MSIEHIRQWREYLRQTRIGLTLASLAGATPRPHHWQQYVDELWQRWRDTMPEEWPPPPRPQAGTEAEMNDAIDTLQRALTELLSASLPCAAPNDDAAKPEAPAPPARKRSTARGAARAKLIAALTLHHQYANGGCLYFEPIGNNELAKAAGVSASTASTFFNDKFQGHTKYKALCRDAGKLTAALKLLNDEFAPYHLLGAASSDLAAPEHDDADSQ